MKFKNTLRNKLLLFTLTAILLHFSIIAFSLWKTTSIYNSSNHIVSVIVTRSFNVLKLQTALEKSNNYLLNYSHSPNLEQLQKYNKLWEEEINPTLEKIKIEYKDIKEEKTSLGINSLLIATTSFYFSQQEVINTVSTIKKETEVELDLLFKSKINPQLTTIHSIIDDIQAKEKNNIGIESYIIKKYYTQTLWTSILFLLSGIGFLLAVPYLIYKGINSLIEKIHHFIHSISMGNIPAKLKVTNDEWDAIITSSNKLIDNLENVKTFASEVGNGNFETNINVFNNEGELGSSLAGMRDSLIKVAEEDKKRNWGTNGLAQMGEILRNNTVTPQELYLNITSFLIKYIDANQGGMFLLNTDNKEDIHLELVACHAFNRRKYLEKRIEVGEGLVGQSILEKDVIYLTEVPNNYVTITSGLGGANPRCIVIVPLVVNNEIYGALEFASFHIIEKHKVEFLKKVAESIASTISTVKINERTKSLLDSSQQMTEQLRAQEEEMRQNVEELQATQEEMYRKQIEADGQMSAINGLYLFTEFDLNGHITHANELFLKTLKYSLDEIIGKNHSILVEENSTELENHDTFWKNLQDGMSQSGEFKRIAKDGSEVWLIANYTPVFDTNGELIKVIKLASDITANKYNTIELLKQIQSIENTYAVIEYDSKGCLTKINDIALSITGYTQNEVTGRHYSIFVDSEYKQTPEYTSSWQSIMTGKSQKGSYKLKNKKGEDVYVEGSYNPIGDNSGKIYKVLFYFTNNSNPAKETNTELKKELLKQEEELRRNLEELKSIQEEMQKKSKELNSQLSAINNTMAIAAFSIDGKLLEANDLFLLKLNLSLEEIQNKSFHLLNFKEKISSAQENQLWKELKENKTCHYSNILIDSNKKEIFTHIILIPVTDHEQMLSKVLAIFLEATIANEPETIKKLKEKYETRIKELESKLK